MVDGRTEIDDVLELVRSYRGFMTGLAARSKPLKLSADGCLILLLLRDLGGASNTELADALGLNLSTATKIVDRLVSDNLVHRKPHPTDRRRIQIYLTEESGVTVRHAAERFSSFVQATSPVRKEP